MPIQNFFAVSRPFLALLTLLALVVGEFSSENCSCSNGGANVCLKVLEERDKVCEFLGGNSTTRSSDSIYWASVEQGYLPRGALRAGYEFQSNNLYIGLASLQGGYIVGKVGERMDGSGGLYSYVGLNGKQYQVTPDLVLVAPPDSVAWVLRRRHEAIPRGAISAGRDPIVGTRYYIGRTARDSNLLPGKIIDGVICTVLHDEKAQHVYEVLVDKSQA